MTTYEGKTAAELRVHLERSGSTLQATETAFHAARQGQERAIQAASARDHLTATETEKKAGDEIFKAAAAVEEVLSLYNEANSKEYAAAIQEATTQSRALHVKRQELEQELRDLDQEIAAATEKEAPFVSIAVAKEQQHSAFAQGVNELKIRCVRLVHESRARAA